MKYKTQDAFVKYVQLWVSAFNPPMPFHHLQPNSVCIYLKGLKFLFKLYVKDFLKYSTSSSLLKRKYDRDIKIGQCFGLYSFLLSFLFDVEIDECYCTTSPWYYTLYGNIALVLYIAIVQTTDMQIRVIPFFSNALLLASTSCYRLY